MSVKLTPEEDQYDFHGYSMNKKLCLKGVGAHPSGKPQSFWGFNT